LDAGWQPVRASAALSMVAKDGYHLGADPTDGGVELRVQQERGCSTPDGFAFTDQSGPELTRTQQSRLTAAYTATTETLADLTGQPPPTPFDQAIRLCAEDQAGVSWSLAVPEQRLPTPYKDAITKAEETVDVSDKRESTFADGGAQTKLTAVERHEGLQITYHLTITTTDNKTTLTTTADSPCLPARG
jgi:hypothetical protein